MAKTKERPPKAKKAKAKKKKKQVGRPIGPVAKRETAFGAMITEARVKKSWSIEKMANEYGVTRAQINNMELGVSTCRAYDLQTLCNLLSLDPTKVVKALHQDAYED